MKIVLFRTFVATCFVTAVIAQNAPKLRARGSETTEFVGGTITTDTKVNNGMSVIRLNDIEQNEIWFHPVGISESICCCLGDSLLSDDSTCSVKKLSIPCLCGHNSEGDARKGTSFSPPKDKPGSGVCGIKGSFWWSTKMDCDDGAVVPFDAFKPNNKMLYFNHDTIKDKENADNIKGLSDGFICRGLSRCFEGRWKYDTYGGGRGPKKAYCAQVCVTGPGCECKSNTTCFSSESRVNVKEKGIVPIYDVKIGDLVQSRMDGTFSKVWGFHRNDSTGVPFLQIATGTESVLEVTPRHMIYLNGKTLPVHASQVKVGDELQTDSAQTEMLKVSKIEHIHRTGFYNPLTEDGTIVVNGVVSSIHSISPGSNSDFFDKKGIIHWHSLSQIATAPIRVTCKTVWSGLCANKHFHDEEGLHKSIVLLKSMRDLTDWQQAMILPVVFGVGITFHALEVLYDAFMSTSESTRMSDLFSLMIYIPTFPNAANFMNPSCRKR